MKQKREMYLAEYAEITDQLAHQAPSTVYREPARVAIEGSPISLVVSARLRTSSSQLQHEHPAAQTTGQHHASVR